MSDLSASPGWIELARLAGAAYRTPECCGAWQRQADLVGRGARARVWRNGARVVVTLRGTASSSEGWQDLRLLLGREPRAWRHVRPFLLEQAPGGATLVGHSIGGAFAHLLSLDLGWPAVTFNAPGVACIRPSARLSAPITNLCAREDWIWRLSGPGLGRTLEIPVADGHRPPHGIGPRGVVAALRAGARREGYRAFVARSLRLHAVHALCRALQAMVPADDTALSCSDACAATSSPSARRRSRSSGSRRPARPSGSRRAG